MIALQEQATSVRFAQLWATLSLLSLAGCASQESRTQIMAIVEADALVAVRAQTLRVQVYGRVSDASEWEETVFDETIEPFPALPFRVALVPKRGQRNRQFRVVALAQGMNEYQVRAQVIGNFQPELTLAVDVFLDDRCSRVSCDAVRESCRAGECVDAKVENDKLRVYDPDEKRRDAGLPNTGPDAAASDSGAADCVAGTTTCSDDTLVMCDTEGKISQTLPCSNGCESGRNRCRPNDCEPGTTQCVGMQQVVCDPEGKVASSSLCPNGCNASTASCYACEPSSTLCDQNALIVCTPEGEVASNAACTMGCSAARCLDLAPSNGLAEQLDMLTASDPNLVMPSSASFNTDTGEVRHNGVSLAVPSSVFAVGGVTSARVFRVQSLHAESVRVDGAAAIVILSEGPIVITGLFDVSGDRLGDGGPGPGATPGDQGPGSRPENHECTGRGSNYVRGQDYGWRGTGGGGGITAGGQGGAGPSLVVEPGMLEPGAAGGMVHGNPELVPLVGGCRGGKVQINLGDFAPHGRAGGAVQLVSRTEITISGQIDAGGGGGGIDGEYGGMGGGSGGGILLEAPQVVLTGLAASITANGGGGSVAGGAAIEGAGSCNGKFGEDGRRDESRAEGGLQCSLQGGAGGAGGTKVGGPLDGSSGTRHGGGGGGAAGRIRVNTLTGFMIRDGAVVSPPASEGVLGTR